ncbi:DUF3391 domain-containing protein [Niveibacterium sp. 24ML]|uniref:HD-GYP domain-containing protein n=1 Tax=Niveibacterium sp. 24ML TaxID=2985512 RepID=UPI00226F5771|nr:HD domain-containing phosphohydrolase [Niveibacterium sp. 24ML]MCX9156688.1 DUF3391 domain-containing protein [Niveibacterium sp. 24ML]
MSEPDSHYVSPEQLRTGLFVHLDLGWMDHPFSFSSFKIRNDTQLAQLRALGLARIRYSPERSDCEPLPKPAENAVVIPLHPEAPPVRDESYEDPAIAEKRARAQRLKARRALFSRCEREFQKTTQAVKLLNQNLSARPDWAREEAKAMVGQLVDCLSADGDVAINLMADRIGADDVYVHSLNVAVLSLMLAREQGMGHDELVSLGLGALMHDIGKMDVPPKVLMKQDALTSAENALLKEHVSFGVKSAARIGLAPDVLAVIAQHHEHVDGSGYPRGLTGDKISLLAKIVAIANTYDNLCNPQNPARGMTPHEALALMYAQHRNRFEVAPLNTFIRCLGVYPPGTIVVLNNDNFGLVVSVNSSRPLKPEIVLYDPAIPKEEAIILSLENEPEIQIARTLRPAQLPRSIFDYLSPRKRVAYYFEAHSSDDGSAEGKAA